jgi:heat shock protein HslJ
MKKILFLSMAAMMMASCSKKNNPTTTGPMTPASLTGTYWKLVELNGQPFDVSATGKPSFLKLEADGKVSASAGCNNMFGTYTLNGPTGISFGDKMGSTMMACPDMQREDAFKKMLTEVNNYAISENKLMLAKNRMAPAARFEAAIQPK